MSGDAVAPAWFLPALHAVLVPALNGVRDEIADYVSQLRDDVSQLRDDVALVNNRGVRSLHDTVMPRIVLDGAGVIVPLPPVIFPGTVRDLNHLSAGDLSSLLEHYGLPGAQPGETIESRRRRLNAFLGVPSGLSA